MNAERYLPLARTITIGVVVIALVALAGWYFYIGGERQSIEEVAAGRGFGGAIPSFDAPGGSTFGNLLGSLPTESVSEAAARPRLSQIHAAPVSGFRLGSTTVQFMDRSGYLFTADLLQDQVVRTTNTLIPRVSRVILGDTALLGFAFDEGGDAEAFVGVLQAATTSGSLPEIAMRPLGNYVRAASVSGERLLTLVEEPEGGVALIRSEFDSTSPQLILRSAVASWNIASAADRIVLVEKPATGVPTSAYEVRNGRRELLMRDTPGLVLLPRASSTYFLYSRDAGSVSLFASDGEEEAAVDVRTIAEKCVWAPENTENPLAYCAVPATISSRRFLDEWYRGETSTVDSWWRIDSTDGSAKELFTADPGIQLDVYNPQVDPTGRYIVFQNKYDETLWVLRITE